MTSVTEINICLQCGFTALGPSHASASPHSPCCVTKTPSACVRGLTQRGGPGCWWPLRADSWCHLSGGDHRPTHMHSEVMASLPPLSRFTSGIQSSPDVVRCFSGKSSEVEAARHLRKAFRQLPRASSGDRVAPVRDPAGLTASSHTGVLLVTIMTLA